MCVGLSGYEREYVRVSGSKGFKVERKMKTIKEERLREHDSGGAG